MFVDLLACWFVPADTWVRLRMLLSLLVSRRRWRSLTFLPAVFCYKKFSNQFMFLELKFKGPHSWKAEEDGFDTCREKNSICERQMYAKWGKKCAHDDFTLEVWVLGRKGSWGYPIRCFQWCIASKRRWILIWWGVNEKTGSCNKGILKIFAWQK